VDRFWIGSTCTLNFRAFSSMICRNRNKSNRNQSFLVSAQRTKKAGGYSVSDSANNFIKAAVSTGLVM
jgi:hypothetical protein